MSSKIDIVNQALTMLGASRIISLDDDVTEADVMKTIYEPVKRAFLRSYPWNCATRRARLAQRQEVPENEFEFAFSLPSDSLRVLGVYVGDRIMTRDPDEYTEFTVEGNLLLANHTNVYIKYIQDIKEVEFDPHAEMAFVAKLAAEGAYPLQGSPSNVQMLIQIAELKMVEARTTDNLESGTEIFRTDRLDLVRL